MRTLLTGHGEWRAVSASEEADVYVVNTCSVTARADARARNMIRRIHSERPGARIVAAGCYAQRAPEEIARLEGISLILGTADRERVVEELDRTVPGEVRTSVSPISAAKVFPEISVREMTDRTRAFVKVQEGCNESCTFCIIPRTRGASRSRRPENVLAQIGDLVESGYTEIVLTGVHLGDYGLDLEEGERLLVSLIESVLAVPGLDRFRLSSIEPGSISEGLVDLLASHDKFARHLHIPLQSGCDDILARMRRSYTFGSFADLVTRIADRIPDCGIGTDVICGFPGETDAHFRRTFDRIAELPITYLHPFTYSVRPGSEAERYGDQVPGDLKKRRTRALKRLSRDKSRAFRERHVGRVLPIVVESARRNGGPRLGGLTDNYLRVDLGPGETEDTVVWALLTGVTDDGLTGERTGAP